MEKMKWTPLFLMAVLSFIAMYILMFAMVDSYGNVYANLNQFYIAGLMTAAMVIIEIAIMRSMYGKGIKAVAGSLGVIGLIVFFVLIRNQVGITEKEFLKSMISHHGSALLMCDNNQIQDPDIKKLCGEIISSQQGQIDWMRDKLSTLK